ncbi:TetR/AcrR family transcriptional regulator [Nonomuraea glycinis]|nr:TetR/AcrR family transcriptional regulator [Nonomuraea glycinis]MCA2181373.1 TetR/AcrR family transcriptional regulator [Nonomuraea glycinis]
MSRWEPQARERLVRAAVELFDEHGYDSTTVVQIAQRAGLTKSTFFRHFPDKREVLFAGQDVLCELLAGGIDAAPDEATPLSAVAAGLEAAAGNFTPELHAIGPALRAVVESNSDLREREALKHHSFADAMTLALRRRGIADPAAGLAAWLGVLAFTDAYACWIDPACDQELTALLRLKLRELRAAISSLD